jgi:hypothetical protein
MRAKATTQPTVAPIGLDLGREYAHRQHRRQRFRRWVGTIATAVVIAGGVGVLAYVGYQAWQDQEKESDGGEHGPSRLTNDQLEQYLTDLEDRPAWNGPGNPTFGVGLTDQP